MKDTKTLEECPGSGQPATNPAQSYMTPTGRRRTSTRCSDCDIRQTVRSDGKYAIHRRAKALS